MPNPYSKFGGNYYDPLYERYRSSFAGDTASYDTMFNTWWKSQYEQYANYEDEAIKYWDKLLKDNINPFVGVGGYPGTTPTEPTVPGPGNQTPPVSGTYPGTDISNQWFPEQVGSLQTHWGEHGYNQYFQFADYLKDLYGNVTSTPFADDQLPVLDNIVTGDQAFNRWVTDKWTNDTQAWQSVYDKNWAKYLDANYEKYTNADEDKQFQMQEIFSSWFNKNIRNPYSTQATGYKPSVWYSLNENNIDTEVFKSDTQRWNEFIGSGSGNIKYTNPNKMYWKDNSSGENWDWAKLLGNSRAEWVNWQGQDALRFWGAEGTADDRSDDKMLAIVGNLPEWAKKYYGPEGLGNAENYEDKLRDYVKYDLADYWRQYMRTNDVNIGDISSKYKQYPNTEDLLAASSASWIDQGDKFGLQLKTANDEVVTTLDFANRDDIPSWLKKYYGAPNLILDKEFSDYQQAIPEQLQEAADYGYGSQWMRSAFEGAMSPNIQEYGNTIRGINNMQGAGGLRSGFGNKDKQMAEYQLGMLALGAKSDVAQQDYSYRQTAQDKIDTISQYNKTMEQSLNQWNRQQEFTDYQMNLYRNQQDELRQALEEAKGKEFWGDIASGLGSLLPLIL